MCYNTCTGSQFSFVPGYNCVPSLIDHITVDEGLSNAILACHIGTYSPLNVSRHLPIHFATL